MLPRIVCHEPPAASSPTTTCACERLDRVRPRQVCVGWSCGSASSVYSFDSAAGVAARIFPHEHSTYWLICT